MGQGNKLGSQNLVNMISPTTKSCVNQGVGAQIKSTIGNKTVQVGLDWDNFDFLKKVCYSAQ